MLLTPTGPPTASPRALQSVLKPLLMFIEENSGRGRTSRRRWRGCREGGFRYPVLSGSRGVFEECVCVVSSVRGLPTEPWNDER